MISPDEAFEALAEACPSFIRGVSGGADVPGSDGWSHLSWHLVDLVRTGALDELPAVTATLDRLLLEGDDHTVLLLRTAVIEEIQNITSHRDVAVDPGQFRLLLGPAAAEVWDELDEAWLDAAAHRSMEAELPDAADFVDLGPEERRRMQATTRELPDGTLARPSDVLRYESGRYGIQLEARARWRRRLPLVWLVIGLAVAVIWIIAVS